MRIYDASVMENGHFTSESEPVLQEFPDLLRTVCLIQRLLWLAPQNHRDILRSLTAGMVCKCLTDILMSE